jgi:hypothetical protein
MDPVAREKLLALGYRLAYQNIDYDVLLRPPRRRRGAPAYPPRLIVGDITIVFIVDRNIA